MTTTTEPGRPTEVGQKVRVWSGANPPRSYVGVSGVVYGFAPLGPRIDVVQSRHGDLPARIVDLYGWFRVDESAPTP